MNDYQKEQGDALRVVRTGLRRLGDERRSALVDSTRPYLAFRREVDSFLQRHVSRICTPTCYERQTSACCSRDGVITFFADLVVNALQSTPAELDSLESVLNRENKGHRCIYLGRNGCLWRMRPVVCAMFLCDKAEQRVFTSSAEAKIDWEQLRAQEKGFTWPDRAVLFDDLEKVFLRLGLRSSLMHLNFGPGLLRIKQKAGLIG